MNSRQYDLEVLRKDWKTASRRDRRLIDRAADKIRKEDGKIRSMREALIKEHRKRDKANIQDIHEYVAGKERYRNE